MAVRQYIGARYVPRFLGTYDPTQIYDALDVVDNGGGTSYIARKTVPAGTSLTNTEYWFVYGASSGAILDLQTRMDAAENDIDGLQTDVSDLEDEKVNLMKEKTFLFMADSYDVGADFISKVGSWIKCKTYIKRSVSGASFVRHDAPFDDNTYIKTLTVNNPLSSAELNSITDVVICPSVNDFPTDAGDMWSAMQTLDTYLRANIPNLQSISVISVGWASCNESFQLRIAKNLRYYAEYGNRLGWKYIDCTRVMRMCYWVSTSDGYHPTADGGTEIAKAVTGAILTGKCSWSCGPLSYYYTFGFPASMGTPSISRPSDGRLRLVAKCDENGVISWTNFATDIFIGSIDLPSYDRYNITLTPETDYRNFFPTYYRVSEVPIRNAGSSGNTGCWDYALYFQTTSGLQLRVWGGASEALTNRSLLMNSENHILCDPN